MNQMPNTGIHIFYVIKYDMKWYEKDLNMMDMSIMQPTIEGDALLTMKDAKNTTNKLNSDETELIKKIKKNDRQYKGKRYIYSYYAGR